MTLSQLFLYKLSICKKQTDQYPNFVSLTIHNGTLVKSNKETIQHRKMDSLGSLDYGSFRFQHFIYPVSWDNPIFSGKTDASTLSTAKCGTIV